MTMHDELIELVAEGLWQRSRKELGLRSEYLPKSRTDLRTEAATALSARSDGWREGVEAAAKALEADAQLCDCHAHSSGECTCGAWDDYKSITAARAIEIVRELLPTPPETTP